jgi:hypothetical protein
MANHHLKFDFEALAIDLHLSEETRITVLTLVSTHKSLEVSLPQALQQFRDRICRMLPEVSPRWVRSELALSSALSWCPC